VPKPPQQQHSRATDNSAPEAAAHSSRVTHAAEKPQHEHLTGHANDRTSAPVHQAPHQTTHQSDTHAVRHSDPPPAPVAHQTAATPSTHQPTSSSHDTSSSSHDHSSSGRR
jgi:hypothetical protein